jgi:HSP20 family protein
MLLQKREAKPEAPLARPFGGEDPFALMHERMDRLFRDFFPEGWAVPAAPTAGAWAQWPSVDVSLDADKVRVKAELPGLDEKDIQLTVDSGRLVLSGEKKAESEEKGENWVRRERSFGSFERVIALPADVLADKAEAKFAKGVLTVEIPRQVDERNKPRTIPVKPA